MKVRQSDLKTWQKCPLMYRWQNLDQLPRLQSGSLTFGSIMHDCVLWLEVNQDVDGAIARFKEFWQDPAKFTAYDASGQDYAIDYYVRGTNFVKYRDMGPDLLQRWWNIIQWETDMVLGREFNFTVPIGQGHELTGTIDKLTVRYDAGTGKWIILISDYKTNNKVPTYGYLEEDLQFSAYAYATTKVEFWLQYAAHLGLTPERGRELFEQYKDLERHGEWVSLVSSKRMKAGIRTERHYNRLIMAVNALADSVAMRIFVPNISGESCRYCEFRNQCGLPELVDD